jgi:FlaA1/EpsC-like NDP-sugar epimerase
LARLRRIQGWPRYAGILTIDALIVGLSFYVGFLVRFEAAVPVERMDQFWSCLPILLSIRLPLHILFGIHRWSFRLSGFDEAVRVILTSLTGTGLFVTVFYSLQRAAEDVSIGPPRSVIAVEFLITTALLGALRFSPRFAESWSLDTLRGHKARVRAVIVGAGSAGELLLRDLKRSHEHSWDVVGFVDDDPHKLWTTIGGKPVLGPIASLPDVVRSKGVREVLLAIPRMRAGRLREILGLCADLKLSYRTLPVSFAYLNDRVTASMLHDLVPEDLLQRPEVRFDDERTGQMIRGRRVLVTGAGGSIGGEICRQVAARGPESLALLDISENEMYLLARRLEQEHPGVRLCVEVANVRDSARLARLFGEQRPQIVFHAAAHKHVPLMEIAPEEAVLTNVMGVLGACRAADAAGVERFVLISSDKAVNPTSVMGATKHVAELIVRRMVQQSRTGFTAVRFGNVLGSSGSVVPLFKAQIAAGGPVTVTHPEVRRYLMTLREAVGLVLIAGLNSPGDLAILEMGEPIRILDLARLMITLAGSVPEEEVPIVFTGFRPGEKLNEELMTVNERRDSRPLGEIIRVIATTPPPSDLVSCVESLGQAAAQGDRAALLAMLQHLVPTYTPHATRAVPPPTA